jgi:hypothetical protein
MNKIIKIIIGFLLLLTIYFLLLSPSAKCSTDNPYLENGKCVASCASGKRDDKKCLSTTENCPTERSNLDNGVCVASCPTSKVNDNGVCVASCPTSKVNDNGVCVASCPTSKVNDNGVCVSSCPTIRPAVINGVCNPCSSNTNGNTYNNNGVCVSSCPSDKVNDNGVCKSFMLVPQITPSSTGYGFDFGIDGNFSTVFTPNFMTSMVWYLFRWNTSVNVKGIILKFQVDSAYELSPLILKVYKDVDNTIQTGDNLSTREFPSSNLVYTTQYTSIPNPNIITIQQELNLTNVNNILVMFTRRTNIYDIQFY